MKGGEKKTKEKKRKEELEKEWNTTHSVFSRDKIVLSRQYG
jgi:hypothetical protein